MRRNKYNAKRTSVDGYMFDSMREAHHYGDLKLMERAGELSGIEVHPVYPIEINGMRICAVEADFRFVQRGTIRVQDVKGMDTALSKIKRKLVKAIHGVEIEVVK